MIMQEFGIVNNEYARAAADCQEAVLLKGWNT